MDVISGAAIIAGVLFLGGFIGGFLVRWFEI